MMRRKIKEQNNDVCALIWGPQPLDVMFVGYYFLKVNIPNLSPLSNYKKTNTKWK